MQWEGVSLQDAASHMCSSGQYASYLLSVTTTPPASPELRLHRSRKYTPQHQQKLLQWLALKLSPLGPRTCLQEVVIHSGIINQQSFIAAQQLGLVECVDVVIIVPGCVPPAFRRTSVLRIFKLRMMHCDSLQRINHTTNEKMRNPYFKQMSK